MPTAEIPDDAIVVADNQGAHRYELRVNGELAAFTDYRLEPNAETPERPASPRRIVLVHTETLDGFAGHGLASRLVRAELDTARSRGLRVVPRCPFVPALRRRTPRVPGSRHCLTGATPRLPIGG